MYNKVMEIRNTSAMTNDNRLEIAAIYQKLASLKKFQGKYFEAEALAKKSLDVRLFWQFSLMTFRLIMLYWGRQLSLPMCRLISTIWR